MTRRRRGGPGDLGAILRALADPSRGAGRDASDVDEEDVPELEDNSARARAIRLLDLGLGIGRPFTPERLPSLRDCLLCGRAGIGRRERLCGNCAMDVVPTPLRRWRSAMGVSLTELSRSSGIHWRTLLRADRGDRMSRDVADLLARLTGIAASSFRDPKENEWLE